MYYFDDDDDDQFLVPYCPYCPMNRQQTPFGPSPEGPGFGPPFGPSPGAPGTGVPPAGPPPSAIPKQPLTKAGQQPGILAVDPGAIRPCRRQFVYLWMRNGREFWAWLSFVGRRSVAGWRWTGYRWVYFGVDLRDIVSFQCYGRD